MKHKIIQVAKMEKELKKRSEKKFENLDDPSSLTKSVLKGNLSDVAIAYLTEIRNDQNLDPVNIQQFSPNILKKNYGRISLTSYSGTNAKRSLRSKTKKHSTDDVPLLTAREETNKIIDMPSVRIKIYSRTGTEDELLNLDEEMISTP